MPRVGHLTLRLTGSLPRPRHDVLMVLGSAPGFLIEAKAFWIRNVCDVSACNAAIPFWPGPLILAASLHPEILPRLVNQRIVPVPRPMVLSGQLADGVDVVLDSDQAQGSSAMLLVLAGRLMGYRRMVLAGVRLERLIDAPYRPIWEAAKASGILDGVETLATEGWLKELLAT